MQHLVPRLDLADSLDNRYDDPALATIRADLTTDLAHWMIRVRDDLPEAAYTLKRAPHNWH
ncbi:hypothetical protein [Nonomuraea sp. NPDC049158]|uniref:hypothetical protein n=1 Tax=Nonomuraea sp. NPDC049158 TaxID=3155649 RepID=UPI0033F9325B